MNAAALPGQEPNLSPIDNSHNPPGNPTPLLEIVPYQLEASPSRLRAPSDFSHSTFPKHLPEPHEGQTIPVKIPPSETPQRTAVPKVVPQAPSQTSEAPAAPNAVPGMPASATTEAGVKSPQLPDAERRIAGTIRGVLKTFHATQTEDSETLKATPSRPPSAGNPSVSQKIHPPPQLSAPLKIDSHRAKHPLAFDPAAPKESLLRIAYKTLRHLPEKINRIRAYVRRVHELAEGVTDEDLRWSLSRLGELKSQEGILRSDNVHLVNKWKYRGPYMQKLSPDDFRDSSLDPPSLVRAFKAGMDNEAPTLQYQFTSAHNLHNHMPRVAHFMGWTMQEYILAVALKGRQGQQAIWATEEVRHGPILEAVYNKVRQPGRPALEQQGIASKEPAPGAYSARSMMANRALAEFAAAAAYLLIKANSAKNSPTDLVLDGIYRDEVYHKVIMEAVNMFVYGQKSRWHRIFMILRHNWDYPKPPPNDTVIYDRKIPSPLLLAELAYAFNALDRRVDRYLRALSPEYAKEMIGDVYPTDKDVQDAIARGEHTWTPCFKSVQNSELTLEEVKELERRFPSYYHLSDRKVRESEVRGIIKTYRKRSLSNPNYWLRKKGFAPMHDKDVKGPVLFRPFRKAPNGFLKLYFPDQNSSPIVSILDGQTQTLFTSPLDQLSMLQIGALMDAENIDVLQQLESKKKDLSIDEIIHRLNNAAGYQKNPISVVHDIETH